MKPVIYYFSGTGNSLFIAKDLATKLNCTYTSIPVIISNETIVPTSTVIGIVYPVYHQGIPCIVKKFIGKITNLKNKYIFAIATYGDNLTLSLEHLNSALKAKNGYLSAGYGIKMPYNYIKPSKFGVGFYDSFTLSPPNEDNQNTMFRDYDKKSESILNAIQAKKQVPIEKDSVVIERLVDFFNLRNSLAKKSWLKVSGYNGKTPNTFMQSIPLMDCGFKVEKICNGCKTCLKVCPSNNICFIDNKPMFNHRCEQCFACLQWCPTEAIQFGKSTEGARRYHHPEIQLDEMLNIGGSNEY